MNLLHAIKTLFDRSNPEQTKVIEAIPYDVDAYMIKHMKEIHINVEPLTKKYGTDFPSFFYRSDLDLFIRKEILPFINPDSKYNDFFDNNHWQKKHSFNFPGPFYTGESDTCGTGDTEAPDNVMYDSYTCEYIFKQPQTFAEFLCVIDAAAVEVFDSYSCDGNNYWTYQKCKEWWNNKDQLLQELQNPEVRKANGDRIQLYIDYLNGKAEIDLRRYCYFLENGIYPTEEETKLPLL